MNINVLIRAVAAIVGIVGVSMSSCVAIAWLMGDSGEVISAFFYSSLISILFAIASYVLSTKEGKIGIREGFAIVTFSWLAVSLFGAIPYAWCGKDISYLDAFFETMSGFTATGASVLENLEEQPYAILYWRSLTQWLGGMGIVVLSLAILPLLGISGMQLYKAEAPGFSTNQLAPRVSNAVKLLWGTYILLSVLQTIFLLTAGMPLFDAWCQTCTTLATGGFSTKQNSIAGFNNGYIEIIIMVFMVLGACNFILHIRALRGDPRAYWKDEECKWFFILFSVAILFVAGNLFLSGWYEDDILTILRYSSFTVLSILTTTGFVIENYDQWPAYSRCLLLCLMVIGGCGGSTVGGMKLFRILLLTKYAFAHTLRCIYPRLLINIRLNQKRVDDLIMSRILSLFFIFFALITAGFLLLCFIEPRLQEHGGLETAVSASFATFFNIGPGLAGIGPTETYAWMSNQSKLLLIFAMLIGRLEVYTVLVLFLPHCWRR